MVKQQDGEAAPVIHTAGYEGQTIDEFLARLHGSGIELVADVRELPLSRKRGFSKTALAAALAREGIDYLHVRALGCPKAIRDRYRRDHDWARYTDAFLDHLGRHEEAVTALAREAAGRRTVCLCFEADPARCHRTYVANAVAGRLGGTVDPIP